MQASTDFWLSGASSKSSPDNGAFIDVDYSSSDPGDGPRRGPGQRRSRLVVISLVVALALGTGIALYSMNRNSTDTSELSAVDETVTAPTTEQLAAGSTNPPAATEPSSAVSGAAVTGPTPADTTTAPPATATMIGDQPLTLRGMGALETGMSLTEVEAALGIPVVAYADDGLPCQYGYVDGDPNSPRLMVIAEDGIFPLGKVVRIELNPSQATRSGIRIGSTKADVIAAYGDRIQATPHKYFTEPGSEYLTYVPVDSADADYRLVIETRSDVVVEIRSGLVPFVEQVEGCS